VLRAGDRGCPGTSRPHRRHALREGPTRQGRGLPGASVTRAGGVGPRLSLPCLLALSACGLASPFPRPYPFPSSSSSFIPIDRGVVPPVGTQTGAAGRGEPGGHGGQPGPHGEGRQQRWVWNGCSGMWYVGRGKSEALHFYLSLPLASHSNRHNQANLHITPRPHTHTHTVTGMVGLSVRYFDVSLALITAHFASDSKGRNRVAKRNRVGGWVGR
jgi:hypothetical protein